MKSIIPPSSPPSFSSSFPSSPSTTSTITPSPFIPAYLSKKALVLIVGEEGVGKSALLHHLTSSSSSSSSVSSVDPFSSSSTSNASTLSSISPLSPTSSTFLPPTSRVSGSFPFTGVKIHPGLDQEGPVWIEFLIVPPRLIPATRAMLYQSANGILGVYHLSEARSFEQCWKRIGHVCEVLNASVWHPHLPSDAYALPVLTVAMDGGAMFPSRSRMTPFEMSLSMPSSSSTLDAFFTQVLLQQSLQKKATSILPHRSIPGSPTDPFRRKPTHSTTLKSRTMSPF